ncbi:hypothetical protein JG688_00018057 [Phytophthora aleatoria]|uniref:Uncharacterized protein n=1 Tax=Phytophthora aleatoria TaxID=2496075 RepID=A0A8J5MBD3_9STRA|nr:hypothetical protein JG688_00018057 [Phytophthora aleatoria]
MNVCAIPGSIVPLKSSRRLVELNKGDIFMFRGDLIYAPVGYPATNLCLHGHLDTPAFERPEDHQPHMMSMVDDTNGRDEPFCFCVWGGGFLG